MGVTQFNALVSLVKSLMAEYGLTLDNVYPHGQVYTTDCPGCIYDKVPELQGGWNYNDFEQAVFGTVEGKEEEEMLDNLVIYADGDVGTALDLSYKLGCPMVLKDFANKYKAAKKHWVGIQGTNDESNFYYSGKDRIATAEAAL